MSVEQGARRRLVHRHSSRGSCGPQSRLTVRLNSGRSRERKWVAVWQTCGHSRSRGQCEQRPGDVERHGELRSGQ